MMVWYRHSALDVWVSCTVWMCGYSAVTSADCCRWGEMRFFINFCVHSDSWPCWSSCTLTGVDVKHVKCEACEMWDVWDVVVDRKWLTRRWWWFRTLTPPVKLCLIRQNYQHLKVADDSIILLLRLIIIIIIIINRQFLTRRNIEHHHPFKGANCQCTAKYSDALTCQLQLNKWVLTLCLKDPSSCRFLTSDGSWQLQLNRLLESVQPQSTDVLDVDRQIISMHIHDVMTWICINALWHYHFGCL